MWIFTGSIEICFTVLRREKVSWSERDWMKGFLLCWFKSWLFWCLEVGYWEVRFMEVRILWKKWSVTCSDIYLSDFDRDYGMWMLVLSCSLWDGNCLTQEWISILFDWKMLMRHFYNWRLGWHVSEILPILCSLPALFHDVAIIYAGVLVLTTKFCLTISNFVCVCVCVEILWLILLLVLYVWFYFLNITKYFCGLYYELWLHHRFNLANW